jgi:hypothetical protein
MKNSFDRHFEDGVKSDRRSGRTYMHTWVDGNRFGAVTITTVLTVSRTNKLLKLQ